LLLSRAEELEGLHLLGKIAFAAVVALLGYSGVRAEECTGLANDADAATYTGKIGKLPVIVEIAAPREGGTFVGRYAYMSKAADIPLHGTRLAGCGVTLEEEKPCTEKLCKRGDMVVETAPIAAEWTLKADDQGLSGIWRDKESGKSLPVKLTLKAKRPLPDDNMAGFEAIDPTYVYGTGKPPIFTPEQLPYDFIKLERPFKQGAVTNLGDVAYRMDEDTRTGLAYPTVLKLGSEDPAPLNAYLLQQRLQFSLPAFDCLAAAYLGFDWGGFGGQGTTGYEESGAIVTVEHFSPRLLGFVESGSFYCGGAYPDNFANQYLVDAKTGQALIAEQLLRGWVATNTDGAVVDPATVEDKSSLTFGPSDELVKFITSHLDASIDASMKSDCGIDDLIRTNLSVYFTDTDMVFTFKDLPHVIFACTTDLASVPLKDARPLLTEAGAKYFAVLDQ
jgi:hypothetical protein